jgi:hypothetical protein
MQLTVPVLERLLGGDTEIEIELRKQIVHEFAKRHLKEIAEQAGYKAAMAEVVKEVGTMIKEQYGAENLAYSHLWPSINANFKKLIDDLIQDRIKNGIEVVLKDTIAAQKRYWEREVETTINRTIDKEVQRQVTQTVIGKLEEALAQVRGKLGA